jgi:hypothetical protein
MAIQTAPSSVAAACNFFGQASGQIVWKENGVEGLLCAMRGILHQQSTNLEPVDLTHEFIQITLFRPAGSKPHV